MNLINNVMNKHHCPTQDKGMSPNGRKTIKKRGLFTLSVFSGIAKHHCYQTSKSPRLRREHQLLLLIAISKIWRF